MISTYFGSITIVLKFPLTKAASTKGLHKYRGLGCLEGDGDLLLPPFCDADSDKEEGLGEGGADPIGGCSAVAEVGVGERLGFRCPARVIERLDTTRHKKGSTV